MLRAPLPPTYLARAYRFALYCYPSAFRTRFGAEMAQTFRDLCQEVYRQRGVAGLSWLSLATLGDLLKTAIEARFEELAHMTREHWSRLAGWALMIGGVVFAAGTYLASFETLYWDELGGFDAVYEYAAIVTAVTTPLLFGIGMFGLWARYGRQSGPLSSLSLLFSGVAGLLSILGGAAVQLLSGNGWYAWMTGFTLLFVGLLVFGISTWSGQVLGRWRGLPVFAGMGVPGLLLASWALQNLAGQEVEGSTPATMLVILVVAANMFLLGHLLQKASAGQATLAA